MVDQQEPAGTEQILYDLDNLLAEITTTRTELGASTPPPSPCGIRKTSIPSPTKSRFSRLTSTFRRTSSFTKAIYPITEETTTAVADQEQEKDQNRDHENDGTRRTSGASDVTLVDKSSASYLLAELAPLVSSLQRISGQISMPDGRTDEAVLERMDETCVSLVGLIEEVKEKHGEKAEDKEEGKVDHDADMRNLLLGALINKVEAEQAKIQVAEPPTGGDSMSPLSHNPNPFVLHSSAISSSAAGPSSRAISKPITPANSAIGGSPVIAGAGQSSWRMNIHRLGSFQASMLFSPSPIAVKRTISVKKQSPRKERFAQNT